MTAIVSFCLLLNALELRLEVNRLLVVGESLNIIFVAHHTRPEVVPIIREAKKWLDKSGHN